MVAGTGELNRARSKSIVNADAGLSPSVPRTSVVDKSHARSSRSAAPRHCFLIAVGKLLHPLIAARRSSRRAAQTDLKG